MRQVSALPKFFFTRVTVVGAISLFADPGSIAQKLLLLVCLADALLSFPVAAEPILPIPMK